MILFKGDLYHSKDQEIILNQLEDEINKTRRTKMLNPEKVIVALEKLGQSIAEGEFDALISQLNIEGIEKHIDIILMSLKRENIEYKVKTELGEHYFDIQKTDPPFNQKKLWIRPMPLGTLLHIAAGNIGRERIGIKDNFFDIGGNSISLIHMHNQLDKIYPGAVKITDIFGHPTILKISDLISRMNEPKGKELRLELLPLQSDYFISKPDNTRGVSFKFDIVGPLFAKFMDKSKEIDCTIGDILLSIYIYLLGKISGESSVSVQVMIGNFDEVLQLCVDMASINDFTELAGVVSTKAKIHKEGLIYRVKELDGSHFQKKGNFILPVFYKSSLLNSDVRLTDYYDIALGTTELEQKVQVLFSYNSRRLKKEKVKELVKNYSILVNSF